jgi:hypothetical protein
MVRNSELPYGRNIPLRTLIAQMLEEIPGVDIYSDNWHLSSDVNKAIGAYMYTILTSDCALAGNTIPSDPIQWRTWMAHKIGYETAWNVMYMKGITPCYLPLSIMTNNNEDLDYLVYPNPTNGTFSIDLGDNYNLVTVSIIGLNGKKIQSNTYKNSQLLDFTLNEPAGVYLLIIESGDKKSTIQLVKK